MEMREEELVLSTVLWRGLDLLFPQGNVSCLIVEHMGVTTKYKCIVI